MSPPSGILGNMGKSGLVDYHLHTPRCGHAVGDLEEYVARALQIGLSEVGFSDHFPLLHLRDPSLSMALEELPEYVGEVSRLAESVSGVRVRLGIEVDYLPGYEERTAEILAAHTFDYVMGAVHFLDGWGFDDPRYVDGYRGRDLYELWARYFQVLGDAAGSGLFDVLAHPDLIKKFGFRPREDVTHLYASFLDRVAAAGLAVEVSTAGLSKPVGEIYPGEDFLRLCRERDIPVTLGSDAHSPREVGRDYRAAVALLRRVGYREIALFERRRRTSLPLPD
ncbi:histidinol-phosphatase HisJ family protein [Candidatus Solincola tengchongensis]|uniref:histidinol-phosphatase HisJ family protein n=1 Tax=Candidatus Solincola tengchongensis TaxID=2900693 RepID=UPI00257CB636|nr:histidinol-phosphatase HisJ family protein [Candidatus Solincola tengchongensis]